MNTPREAVSLSKLEEHPGWVLGLLAFCALVLKAWLLWRRSIYIDPDEGYYLLLARNILQGHGYTMNGLPNIVFPPLLPLLIAAVTAITGHLQLSLGLITSVSGTLLGVVAYKLAREWLSVRHALLTAFLVLFIYPLNTFIPTSTTYVHLLYRGTDILNALLILLLLYLAIRMARTQKIRYALGAGLVAAFAYLVRPEGLILGGIVLMALMALKLAKRVVLPSRFIGSYALVFVLLSAPYVLYLKKVTGHWTLSGKYALSRGYRDSLAKVIRGGDWEDFQRIHYEINPALMQMNDHYFGYYPGGSQPISEMTGIFSNALSNISLSPVIPKVLFPYPLIPFFLIGLGAGLSRIVKKWDGAEILIVSAFLYSILLAGLSYPMPRHHLFLVPVFCLYVVRGIILTVTFLARSLSAGVTSLIVIAALFLAFATAYLSSFNRSLLTSRGFLETTSAERDVARYLKDHNSSVVMAVYPAIAIRSSSDWQVLPKTDFPTLVRFAVKKHVDHIALSINEGPFYRIVDIGHSTIPDDIRGELGFQTIERRGRFEVVRLVAPNPR